MSRTKRRFSLEKITENSIVRYAIFDDELYEEKLSQWVMCKCIRKASTGREYGGRLVFYLNYLDSIDIEYADADNDTVKRFINYAIYGDRQNNNIVSTEPQITYSTLNGYIVAVTEFYKWLDDNYESNMEFEIKTDRHYVKKSFFYGQIYSQDYKYLIDKKIPLLKPKREFIKWYSDEEKESLCKNFKCLRDEAVFRLTLEGFRIDEVLSMELGNYDSLKRLIQPMRSKGKLSAYSAKNNTLRTVALPQNTCDIIDRYIVEERTVAENESGVINQNLFININDMIPIK